jgi:hypothetical protein
MMMTAASDHSEQRTLLEESEELYAEMLTALGMLDTYIGLLRAEMQAQPDAKESPQ